MLSGIWEWLQCNLRLITYVSGSGLVALWTVVRHWTNGVNFDVVGQVGIADQWASGLHGGAQLGATNYLFKMPIYWVVNQIGLLSPHGKLLLLALVFNVATFVLILYLFERCLRLYKIPTNPWFYLTALWVASISGRVYWLDYANSRNLETAGGIAVFYVALLLLHRATVRRLAGLLAIGSIMFFADPLQMYVVGGGLVLYMILYWVRQRSQERARRALWVGGGLVGSFAGAKLLTLAATSLLPVSFLVAPRGETVSPHNLGAILRGVLESTARVFDISFYAAASPNAVRELINLGILVIVAGVLIVAWRRRRPNGASAAALCCIAAAYGAYVASGQALQPMTERYLIMVPLFVVLLCGVAGGDVRIKRPALVQVVYVVALCMSALLAIGGLVVSWPEQYAKDTYISAIVQFARQQPGSFVIGNRDMIPAQYFGEHTITALPTICLPDRTLVLSNLFYDRAMFAQISQQQALVPLVVPLDGVRSGDAVCQIGDIEKQLGVPSQTLPVPGYGAALLYSAQQLHLNTY